MRHLESRVEVHEIKDNASNVIEYKAGAPDADFVWIIPQDVAILKSRGTVNVWAGAHVCRLENRSGLQIIYFGPHQSNNLHGLEGTVEWLQPRTAVSEHQRFACFSCGSVYFSARSAPQRMVSECHLYHLQSFPYSVNAVGS